MKIFEFFFSNTDIAGRPLPSPSSHNRFYSFQYAIPTTSAVYLFMVHSSTLATEHSFTNLITTHIGNMEQQLLTELLKVLPFQISEVQNIEENCGTVWIVLNSGKVFALTLVGCEDDQQ